MNRYCFLESLKDATAISNPEYLVVVKWFDLMMEQLRDQLKPDLISKYSFYRIKAKNTVGSTKCIFARINTLVEIYTVEGKMIWLKIYFVLSYPKIFFSNTTICTGYLNLGQKRYYVTFFFILQYFFFRIFCTTYVYYYTTFTLDHFTPH